MPYYSLRHGDTTARLLAGLGLIPFLAGGIGAWAMPASRPEVLLAVVAYGAVILSFIGAVHWGRVMTAPLADPLGSLWLVASVTPALIGWGAVLLPPYLGVPVLVAGFVVVWDGDRRACRDGLVPSWYGPLRTRLTLVVCLSLGAVWPLAL